MEVLNSDEVFVFDEKKIESMRNTIDKMNKNQHIEILQILKSCKNVKLNENRNGIYINLSFLPNDVILKINKYVSYITEQEQSLEQFETQKRELLTTISS